MTQIKLKEQLAELIQLVDAFFKRDTVVRARASFNSHRAEVLKQIPEMGELLREYPAYGAIAFLGRFKFTECAEVNSLAKGSSAQLLQTIRDKKVVQLEEAARPAWSFLLESDMEASCAIMALCFMARKNAKIKQVLAA